MSPSLFQWFCCTSRSVRVFHSFFSMSNLIQYGHDVVLTSIRRRFKVMDVVWASKWRRMPTWWVLIFFTIHAFKSLLFVTSFKICSCYRDSVNGNGPLMVPNIFLKKANLQFSKSKYSLVGLDHAGTFLDNIFYKTCLLILVPCLLRVAFSGMESNGVQNYFSLRIGIIAIFEILFLFLFCFCFVWCVIFHIYYPVHKIHELRIRLFCS